MPHLPDPGPIAIVGAGGFGRECLDIVEALNEQGGNLRFVGFVDDGDIERLLLARHRAGVLGCVTDLPNYSHRAAIGIGTGSVRADIDRLLAPALLDWLVLIHPQATLGSCCAVEPGVILNAGARVTTNVRLGRHVQVHTNACVGHDAQLDDFVSVYPGATVGGSVRVGRTSTIGAGASVLPGVEIGPGAFVGAGAVVTEDVAPNTTVVGVPARPRSRRPAT